MEAWQAELLDECRVARLGTIAADGRPRLVPVCYALVDGEIVIAVDEKPKRGGKLARVRDIERDPRATLLVDRYDEDWVRLAWVRFDCRATVEPAGDRLPGALVALRARYPQYAAMALEGLPVIVLLPEGVVGWRWGAQS
ncbi:MAG: TIGR03668 family PPOX class F420-dependent oxidoreductase [Chloroflexi bacterium]|nr:TIGR03668 family PPOX class F420-dependent oxidoreductase [Chloroflexota bacterium]